MDQTNQSSAVSSQQPQSQAAPPLVEEPVIPQAPLQGATAAFSQTLPQQSVQPANSSVGNVQSTQTQVIPETMATPIVQAVSAVSPTAINPVPAKTKESAPASGEIVPTIEVVGTDAIEKEPLPPEVASWMEKVNRDNSGEKPPEVVVADASANAPTGSYASSPVFVLPLGDAQYKIGLHSSVSESIRWLAEWCKRLVKKMGEQVSFSG